MIRSVSNNSPSQMISVQISGRDRSDPRPADEWEHLVGDSFTAALSRPGWHLAAIDAFPRHDVAVFAARDGGRLVGVLPLCRIRTDSRGLFLNLVVRPAAAIIRRSSSILNWSRRFCRRCSKPRSATMGGMACIGSRTFPRPTRRWPCSGLSWTRITCRIRRAGIGAAAAAQWSRLRRRGGGLARQAPLGRSTAAQAARRAGSALGMAAIEHRGSRAVLDEFFRYTMKVAGAGLSRHVP